MRPVKAKGTEFTSTVALSILVSIICVGLVDSTSRGALSFGPKINFGGGRSYGYESSALLASVLALIGFWMFSQVGAGKTWERLYTAALGLFGLVTSSDTLRFAMETAWARNFWRLERLPQEPARIALIALVAIPTVVYLTLFVSSLGAVLFALLPRRLWKRNLAGLAALGGSSRAWILRASFAAVWLQLASLLISPRLMSTVGLTFPTVGGTNSGGEVHILFHQWWLHLELLGALRYFLGAWAAVALATQVDRTHRRLLVSSMKRLSVPKGSTMDVIRRITNGLVLIALPLVYLGMRPRFPTPLFKRVNVAASTLPQQKTRFVELFGMAFSPLRGPHNWLMVLLPLTLSVVAGFGLVNLVEYTRSTGTYFHRLFLWANRRGFVFGSSAQLAVVLLPFFALALPAASNSYRLFVQAPASLFKFAAERNQQIRYFAPTNRFPFSIRDPDTLAAAIAVFFVYVGLAVGRFKKSLPVGVFVIAFGFFAFVADVPALVGGLGIGAAIAAGFQRKVQTEDLNYRAASLPILAITGLSVGWALTPDLAPSILVAVALLGALMEVWDRNLSSWTRATFTQVFALPLILLGLCVAEAAAPNLLATNSYGIVGEQFARPYVALPLVIALAIQRNRSLKTS